MNVLMTTKVSLYVALISAMGYATMVFASSPEPTAVCDCAFWEQLAEHLCSGAKPPWGGGLFTFYCDDTTVEWYCNIGPGPINITCP